MSKPNTEANYLGVKHILHRLNSNVHTLMKDKGWTDFIHEERLEEINQDSQNKTKALILDLERKLSKRITDQFVIIDGKLDALNKNLTGGVCKDSSESKVHFQSNKRKRHIEESDDDSVNPESKKIPKTSNIKLTSEYEVIDLLDSDTCSTSSGYQHLTEFNKNKEKCENKVTVYNPYKHMKMVTPLKNKKETAYDKVDEGINGKKNTMAMNSIIKKEKKL